MPHPRSAAARPPGRRLLRPASCLSRICLLGCLLGGLSATVQAQETGGLSLGGDATNAGMAFAQAAQALGRPPIQSAPIIRSPLSLSSINPARARQARDQQAIASIRGDAGFLAGFHRGQPLAASRQPPPPPFEPLIEQPVIINNVESAINFDFGTGNIAQQQINQGNGQGVGQGNGQGDGQGDGQASGAPRDPPSGQQATAATTAPPATEPPVITPPALPGRVSISNVDSIVNLATGQGNTAHQQVRTGR